MLPSPRDEPKIATNAPGATGEPARKLAALTTPFGLTIGVVVFAAAEPESWAVPVNNGCVCVCAWTLIVA